MFKTQTSPLVSTVEHTYKRIISYHIAVWFVVLVALVLQTVVGIEFLLFGFLQIVLAVSFSCALIAAKKIVKKEDLTYYRDYMEAITQALLASLLLPSQAPFFMIISTIILIRLIEVIFTKLFRKNIIHPVLLSILVVQLVFRDVLPISETMINIFQEDTLPLGRLRLLFGLYEGLTLGTSALLILGFLWVYLSVTKIVQLKMSVWYIGNMLFGTLVLALLTEYTLWNVFTLLILGYTLFVLVFFIAEPTSTPETDEMMAIYPFVTALLTIWFRIQFDIIEAALYAVVFAQFFTWVFEQVQNRTYPNRVKTLYGFTGVIWIAIITLLIIL